MSDCGCEIEVKNRSEQKVLIQLLIINGLMFLLELSVGWWAQSTALIADAMDMLADAMVYAVGLYAVGRSAVVKAHAARISGWFQIGLGLLVVLDIGRRFLMGSEPVSVLMIGMGLLALMANITCLYLISAHREGEVHMRASWIFSKNDVIANLGVILAGVLVSWTGSRYPDLIIGLLVASVVVYGGLRILRESREAYNNIS
jgi:cation diffusion facilitator family transporter